MIYVAVLFTENKPDELVLPNDNAAIERIESAKSAEVRESRIFAYSLLERAYSDVFGEPMPRLFFDSLGKPSLAGGKTRISVSHTGGVCAVAFSNFDVGVDVQSYDEMRGKERVLQRFVNKDLQNLIKNAKPPEVSYLIYKTSKSGIVLVRGAGRDIFDEKITEGECYSAAALWSSLEAVLKCRGGFCEYKNAENLLRASKLDTRYLYGAALSVAVIETK